MTLAEIKQSPALYLTAADIAPVLGCDPDLLRAQARYKPELLGFPVCVIGSRVKIPRRAFLAFFWGIGKPPPRWHGNDGK